MFDLGARIRTLRKELNWSQEQLAKFIGIPQSTISNIENGKVVHLKDIPRIKAIRDLLNCTLLLDE